jgi:hypothetical protein
MIKIYKLKYNDRESGINDLINKEVIDSDGLFGTGINAVVEVGRIILLNGVCDDEGNEVEPTQYYDGYHFDVMSEREIDFGYNEIIVNNPKHTFYGF